MSWREVVSDSDRDLNLLRGLLAGRSRFQGRFFRIFRGFRSAQGVTKPLFFGFIIAPSLSHQGQFRHRVQRAFQFADSLL